MDHVDVILLIAFNNYSLIAVPCHIAKIVQEWFEEHDKDVASKYARSRLVRVG